MTANSLLSKSERKLLLCLILTITCLFYVHCFINTVEEYNERVRIEQSEKLFLANTLPSERPSFSACVFAPPFYTQLFWIQFFTNPILVLFLIKPKPLSLFFSMLITSTMTLSLLTWIRRSYEGYLLNEFYWLHETPYGYFSLTTHVSEVVLAILGCVLVITQFWIILRFVIDKFQTKIYQ
ncbi:hypothetical protein BH20ACI1_BH20ACI1_21310 [soil metagenome]